MNDDDDGAIPASGEERRIRTPYAPDDIGMVSGRDVPQIALAQRPPEVIDPPPPRQTTPPQPHGMVYVPAGVPEDAAVAGQCAYCASWYFWPVLSADGVALLQCASCYHVYRPLGD